MGFEANVLIERHRKFTYPVIVSIILVIMIKAIVREIKLTMYNHVF